MTSPSEAKQEILAYPEALARGVAASLPSPSPWLDIATAS
jgi:hypothetical protein